MNANDTTNWDLARIRARASQERAQAYRELQAQLRVWLRGAAHRRARHAGG
jgi:head-tail adaptor